MHRTISRGGFTLIEILVTVAVIGVLASLLVVSLRPARDSARSAVCAANLRQAALACLRYAHENDGLGPAIGQPYAAPPNWALEVQRASGLSGSTPGALLKETSVLVCPSSIPPTDAPMTRTYAMNATGHFRQPWNSDPDSYDDPWPPPGGASARSSPVAIRVDRVPAPARAALLVDSAWVAQTPPLPMDRTASVIDFRAQSGHVPARLGLVHGMNRGEKRFNAAMLDGSITAETTPPQPWLEPLP